MELDVEHGYVVMRFRVRAVAVVLALLATASAAGTDPGQLGRPLRIDARGLLQVDPTFFRLAAETGGDFYFWKPGEFAQSQVRLPLPGEAVALAYGTLATQPRRIVIPVEAGVTRLTVFAGAQRKDFFGLFGPGGKAFAGTGAGESLQSFTHMAIATIHKPEAGVWQLEIRGAGLYSVSAHVSPARDNSAPAFDELRFVEIGGRPGHEGWFPITREPRRGESIQCSASIGGQVSAVAVHFVTAEGQLIAPAHLVPSEEGGDYLGRCIVPQGPFRVRVSGRDAQGRRFQRMESALRNPR